MPNNEIMIIISISIINRSISCLWSRRSTLVGDPLIPQISRHSQGSIPLRRGGESSWSPLFSVIVCRMKAPLFSCCVRTQHENWPVTMVAVSPPLYYRALNSSCSVLQSPVGIGEGAHLSWQKWSLMTQHSIQIWLFQFIIFVVGTSTSMTECSALIQSWTYGEGH